MLERRFCSAVTGALADHLYQELGLDPRQHYRVLCATSGPRVLTLALHINPTHAKRIMGLAEQLSMAAGLDRDTSVRVTRGNRGTLSVEIPKPKNLWYNVKVDDLPPCRGLRAPVGIDVEHRPARVNFGNPLTPHLLAAGTTGSGKTNTARLFVYDLASGNQPRDVKLLLVDTRKRGTAWRSFAALPHLAHPIITDDAEALRALGWAVAEMDRRAVDGRTHPRVFIAVDEAQALLEADHFVKLFGDLAAVGREFGIHLLLATQNPTAQMLGDTSIKRNLTTRLVGKVDSAQAAQVAAGMKGTGAELLTGPGDQLLIGAGGVVTRITTALVTQADMDDLPRAETVATLDLDDYDDTDHVRDQTNVNPRLSPLDPRHVAISLALNRGINWLAKECKIGNKRAGRVKAFADALRMALDDLGYTIIPHPREAAAGSVTDGGNGQRG